MPKWQPCVRLDVKSYPSFLYFPPKSEFGDEQPYYRRFVRRWGLNPEAYHEFVLGGGVKNWY